MPCISPGCRPLNFFFRGVPVDDELTLLPVRVRLCRPRSRPYWACHSGYRASRNSTYSLRPKRTDELIDRILVGRVPPTDLPDDAERRLLAVGRSSMISR